MHVPGTSRETQKSTPASRKAYYDKNVFNVLQPLLQDAQTQTDITQLNLYYNDNEEDLNSFLGVK